MLPTAGSLLTSESNIGHRITYIDAAQADPLPRTARIGTSLKAGLSLITDKQTRRLASFENLYEAELLLVRARKGGVAYDGRLGDIDFWDNVILRKGARRMDFNGRDKFYFMGIAF